MTLVVDTTNETTRPLLTFQAIAGAVRAFARRRAQRIALDDLLHMDAARLDDLGITIEDILDASSAPLDAGSRLRARREANSDFAARRN